MLIISAAELRLHLGAEARRPRGGGEGEGDWPELRVLVNVQGRRLFSLADEEKSKQNLFPRHRTPLPQHLLKYPQLSPRYSV